MAVGAAVGEALLGKKIGNKAPVYGALAAFIPDLDVLFGLFLHPVDYLSIHRGFTHSIFFPFLLAPFLAYWAYKKNKDKEVPLKQWFWFFVAVIISHPLIDIMTGYGTQFFYPISRYAIELNTIFIIDPLFTIPLLVGIIYILVSKRARTKRTKINYTVLGISFSYLMLTVVFKLFAMQAFYSAIERDNIQYERMRTFPGPFASFFWRGLIETEDGYYEGYHSLFGSARDIEFHFIPRNEHKIKEIKDSYAVGELLWFSKGYYHISTNEKGNLVFNDLRFGSYLGFMGDYSDFIFSFKILKNKPDQPYPISFNQEVGSFSVSASDLRKYFLTAWGRKESHLVATPDN